jgi:hypothetical protein
LDEGETIDIDTLFGKYQIDKTDHHDTTDGSEIAMAKIKEIVARLDHVGLKSYYADITSDEVDSAGFKVIHAIIPSAVPLNGRHPVRPLGCKRLRSVPVKMGFAASEKGNLVPHPYP